MCVISEFDEMMATQIDDVTELDVTVNEDDAVQGTSLTTVDPQVCGLEIRLNGLNTVTFKGGITLNPKQLRGPNIRQRSTMVCRLII